MEQKTAYERLKEYEKKGAHMLIPSVIEAGSIASGFALIVEPVLLKAHPRDKDVYAHDSKEYNYTTDDWKAPVTGKELVRIHKQGFDRLAQAARIDWLPAQIIRDPVFPGRMMASIEGMIRTSTGELYRVPDIAGMDLDIEMEKIIANYSFNGKFDEKKQWMVDRDFLQKKSNQPKLCISSAKNRVIKQLLCLRNTYSVAEMKLEFVAVRIVPQLDMNDEYTRRRVVDVQIASLAGIYGLLPNAQPVQQQIEMVGKVPDSAMRDESVIEAEPQPEKSKTPESLRQDFMDSDTVPQCKSIESLAAAKKWDLKGWLVKAGKPLETITPAKRLELYDFLAALPSDDVPF